MKLMSRWKKTQRGEDTHKRQGIKFSRRKTEYMFVNERQASRAGRMQEMEVKKVREFKYVASTIHRNDSFLVL